MAEPQDLPHQPSVDTKPTPQGRGRDALWPYYAVTLAYLVFGGVVAFDRWGEIGSLFESVSTTAAGSPSRLPLNSLGDVLAGFFAPLAFLWLFAATQLQRMELKLQREELADTRAVLNEQRVELERAAKESNQQTIIMNDTLKSARSAEVYQLFGIDLYLICRSLSRLGDRKIPIAGLTLYLSTQRQGALLSANDLTTIDNYIDEIGVRAKEVVKTLDKYGLSDEAHADGSLDDARNFAAMAEDFFQGILDDPRYQSNSLVSLRCEGLNLQGIVRSYQYILSACFRQDFSKLKPSPPPVEKS